MRTKTRRILPVREGNPRWTGTVQTRNPLAHTIMFKPDQYELVDFGEGRKLERFGEYVVDRPSRDALGTRKQLPDSWSSATARFEKTDHVSGHWRPENTLPDVWNVESSIGIFQLKATDFGHVGLFPEQAGNWEWIDRRIKSHRGAPLKVLNLFAHTGGATMAAARAGAEVVHVDAARNVVQWARRNARLSGLDAAPIRWICEDASRFVQRELKRGNKYHAVLLDPPTYGHGPKGEVWKLADHLLPLLRACGRLTEGQRSFLTLSCHTPGYGPAELHASLSDAVFGSCQAEAAALKLTLRTTDGRRLACGATARWPAAGPLR